jgi:hypothetical protein
VPGRNASQRAEQRALREQMRGLGMSRAEIAAEMARRYKLRPRAAWRTAWGWTLPEAADRYNALRGRGQAQPVTSLTASRLSEWENWPLSARRPPVTGLCLLAEMYQCGVLDLIDVADREKLPADQLLALGKTGTTPPHPRHGQHQQQHTGWDDTPAAGDAPRAVESSPASAPPILGPGVDDRMRRPGFAGLTGTIAAGAMLDAVPGRPVDLEPLALVLAGHAAGTAFCRAVPDVAGLAAAADDTRRQYQACRYAGLIGHLPDLLGRLHLACVSLDGEDRLRAHALSADVHHVAAGLLLKLDDPGLACLAADGSMRAAIASDDPLAVGASARIVTHTLMNTGHLAAAIATASSHAARLNRDVAARTPEALSVYGSLLLRGAIAAAQHDQRSTAFELLGEADDAARQLGADGNARWTAFGPVNAKMHHVSICVALGDAGTAVDIARGIDLTTVAVTERKASLLIDVARAFLQWGRHEQAYTALRAAGETAPEEITARPSVRQLIRDLARSAPQSIRSEAEQFATQAGVTR